jgi:hypothetical protein
MSLINMTYTEIQPPITDEYVYNEADFDNHNSAPLLLIGEESIPKLVEKQNQLHQDFKSLTLSELADYTKPATQEYVWRSIDSRMHQREGYNALSYIHRNNEYIAFDQVPSYPEEYVIDAVDNSMFGRGTMIQKEIARQAMGMDSAEYGNLTIIGEKRKALEQSLWEDAGELVGHTTTPLPEQIYGLQMLGFDRDIRKSAHVSAMRIGLKRLLGVTEFGTVVKARTTAIVNISPSAGIDPNIVDLFRETVTKNTAPENGNKLDDVDSYTELNTAYQRISELPEFTNAVKWLVQTELPKKLVLARNETVYGAAKHPNN